MTYKHLENSSRRGIDIRHFYGRLISSRPIKQSSTQVIRARVIEIYCTRLSFCPQLCGLTENKAQATPLGQADKVQFTYDSDSGNVQAGYLIPGTPIMYVHLSHYLVGRRGILDDFMAISFHVSSSSTALGEPLQLNLLHYMTLSFLNLFRPFTPQKWHTCR